MQCHVHTQYKRLIIINGLQNKCTLNLIDAKFYLQLYLFVQIQRPVQNECIWTQA